MGIYTLSSLDLSGLSDLQISGRLKPEFSLAESIRDRRHRLQFLAVKTSSQDLAWPHPIELVRGRSGRFLISLYASSPNEVTQAQAVLRALAGNLNCRLQSFDSGVSQNSSLGLSRLDI